MYALWESQKEKKVKGAENLFKERMAKNLWRKKDIEIQKVQKIPNRMVPKKFTLRHIIMKF